MIGRVTVCFYSALHFINAHLSIFNLQFRKHKDAKAALNPYSKSPAKIPPDEYSAYISLQSLSRRSRYLVNEKDDNLNSPTAFFTYDKHLEKALRHLDKLAYYFTNKYRFDINSVKLFCPGLNFSQLKYIEEKK